MTDRTIVKHYDAPERCAAAKRHLLWLHRLRSGVRLPTLHEATTDRLGLEHLDGAHPGPADLGDVADALGRLHVAAYRQHLHSARLDRPLPTGDLVIADFLGSRTHALRQVPLDVAGLPAALYKDANVRNFVLTADGVAVVDFDTLTLAPFGYDLAKLVVSAVMTYGPIAESTVTAALGTYNAHVSHVHELAPCGRAQFDRYARLHDLLTRPYLGRNGYRFTWPDARPVPHRPQLPMDVSPAASITGHDPIAQSHARNPEVRQ